MGEISIRVGTTSFVSRNYKKEVDLYFGVMRLMSLSGGRVTLGLVPTFVSALITKLDKDIFASLSTSTKMAVMEAWYDACNDSVASTSLSVGEEPDIVY